MTRGWFRAPVFAWLAAGLCLGAAPAWGQRPGARMAFPVEGRVHALVVFVQDVGVPEAHGDFATDPETEWPADWSLGPERRLPAWAAGERLLARPETPPEAFDSGSLSAFYRIMSHGRFTLSGYVYPRVYVPRHPPAWYHANRGALQNGAARLAHEALTSAELQDYLARNPDGWDLGRLDTYRNGANAYAPDGVLDLVVLVHRDAALPELRRLPNGARSRGGSITSLGVDAEWRPGSPDYRLPDVDGFASEPVRLAGLRVVDNLASGSGLTVQALTRKAAVRIIAHELGHRQFGLYHTCEDAHTAAADCIGIMGGAYLTLSAPDRLKLGWAEETPVDVGYFRKTPLLFEDALTSGKVYRLQGRTPGCGDVLVEARTWNNFWDAPPGAFPGNDDGDDGDLFLPQEGLYLYAAPMPGQAECGGSRNPAYDYALYSSLENSGLYERLTPFRPGDAAALRAFQTGGAYKAAYTPGDEYAPHTRPRFGYYRNPWLDARLTVTDIRRAALGFEAVVWSDFYRGRGEGSGPVLYPNPADDYATLDFETAAEGRVTVRVYDLLGREAARLADGWFQAGKHRQGLDTSGLAAGTYLCRIGTGSNTVTTRLVVAR